MIVSHGAVMLTAWIHLTGVMVGVEVPANCGIVVVEHDGERLGAPAIVAADDQPG